MKLINNIQFLNQIGHGSFSTVYKAVNKTNNEIVAVKIINTEKSNNIIENIRQEIIIMESMKHPNINNIIGSFIHNVNICIVMPISIGSIKQIMKKMYPTGLNDEKFMATIIREILKGLEYLHKHYLIHRDIKADNILISHEGDIRISDFGVTGSMLNNVFKSSCKTFAGTLNWMSPEMVEQHGYSYKTDIWSLGITGLELGYGEAPYIGLGPIKPLLYLLREEPPTYELYETKSKYSKSFIIFINKCLQKDYNKRLNATKLLNTKFIKKNAKNSEYVKKIIGNIDIISDYKEETTKIHSFVY